MTASELAHSVAAHGLAGASGAWPTRPLDDAAWDDLFGIVLKERLSGLLVQAVLDGAMPATPEQLDHAAKTHAQSLCAVLRLESAALRSIAVLDGAGIDVRLLKGSATAHLDYPDPALRLFVDVDLLVRSEEIDEAMRLLLQAGHTRRAIQPRAGFDRRFGKGATLTADSGQELDLHRTFVMGPFGLRLVLSDLWETSNSFTLGGRQVQALDAECRFLHACFHTALGDLQPRLVPQRDIAQLLLFGRLDLDRVRRLMRAWHAEPVVARAVALTWQTLRLSDVTALSTWARAYQPSRRAALDLAVYTDPRSSSYTAMSVAALGALPTLSEKAAFAVALALPRRGFVPDDGLVHSGRWRRALLTAVRRARSA